MASRSALVSLFVPAALLFAQSERGSITGLVTDPTGGAIAAASIEITGLSTNSKVAVSTTATGEYSAPNLSPGAYRIQVSAPGFKRFVQDNVTLPAAGTVRLDAQLQVGQVSETVEVTTSVAQIQTENAKISSSVQNKLVDELPLVVGGALRSVFNLVSITPEARGSGNRLALGGGQTAAWDATLDGISVTTNRSADAGEIAYNTPSVEAITEFTVDTNGFKAEYGQAGGGVMTFVSKSGSNEFHGTAYDFLRNDALDARGFFAPRRAVYKQNDFGATLGGPVWIPKLYNGRNKTFFFFSFEGFRNRVGATDQIRSVPAAEMYQGDFTKWVDARNQLIQVFDPATTRANPAGGSVRDPFPGNLIPQGRFSTFAKQIATYGAAATPNRPGLVPGTSGYVRNNFISTVGTILEPQDKFSIKADHTFGANHRVGFLFNDSVYQQVVGPQGPPGLPVPLYDGQEQQFDTQAYRLSYDWTLSSRLLNHLSVGGNRFDKFSASPNVKQDWKDKLCFKNVPDCNGNFPGITLTEFAGWGGTAENGTFQPHWSLKDDLSYIRGKHTFKFGYAFQSQRAEGFGQQDIAGRAGFSFLSTSVPGATSATSGSSFASFLLGVPISGRTETVRYVPQLYRYHGFYAQDDWRLSRKLILNVGLRFEYTQPPVSRTDEYSDFTPDRPNPAVNNFPGALRFAGFGQGRENTRSLVPGWYGGWGPRIGLAYTPDNKTTFRSAFGRSFSKVSVVSGSGHFAGFIGQYTFNSPDQGLTAPYRLDDGLPPYPLPPRIDPSFSNNNNIDHWQLTDAARASENLYWTLSVQRQLSANMVLEAAYNATVGAHLQASQVNLNQVPTRYLNDFIGRFGPQQALNLFRADINSAQARAAGIPIPYANFTNPQVQQLRSVAQALRPFPQYQQIVTGTQGGDKSGHSTYHALVVRLERRLSHGLLLQWSYAFSKILTDADSYYADNTAMDQYNRRLEKSIGRFDQTHALKLNTLFELPFGKGKKWLQRGFLSQVAGGWRLGLIQNYSSGLPIALARNNPLPIFNNASRPFVTGYDNWRAPVRGDRFDPAVDRFLNRSAFPEQPAHLYGNVTRYNPKVREFPILNENISLAKSFQMGERWRADFRWEAFNLFNRTRFGTGPTNLNSNLFGVVSDQTNDPRRMQVALKLYW